jgi:hypothetical protein
MTTAQAARFQNAMFSLVRKMQVLPQTEDGQASIPAGPFAELIKMVAHYGQIPACKTCIHFSDGYLCTQSDDWHEKKPTGFCEEWNPEQPGEKTNG